MPRAPSFIEWIAISSLLAASLTVARPAAAKTIQIGSKADTESTILGEICEGLLRASGVDATYRRDVKGGTQVVWRALEQGSIDVYPEYTGTLSRDILHDERLITVEELRKALAPRGLLLSEPLGFDDSYAMGMKADRAEALGIHTISDLARHPELRFGFSHEFFDRPDGFPGLKARYKLPQTSVTGLDHDLAYRAIEGGTIDLVDVYTTDPEIGYYGLRIVEDDLGHFPKYQAVLIYRASLPEKARDALLRLEGRISREEMMRMNGRVKRDKTPEPEVAAAFLKGTLGLTGSTDAPQSRFNEIAQRTIEHLTLVGISLFFAVLCAVPIGVLCARRPRFGQIALGALGVVQTIPSLALLVFILPLFGIGTAPAVVALFLYSLLPIVRNTTTGLRDIPEALRESAEALGLPDGARLRKIELPLAMRSILAGIKTAAVINVGTATLGAIIGAGGYGQPILVGIRRDDLPTILSGAIPAAALALLVQGVFELCERALVPKGLRLGASRSAAEEPEKSPR